MKIHIENLEIDCIIGLLDFEREHTQRIILDLQIDYGYQTDQFLDYSHIASMLESHLKESRYILLEDALLGIKNLLFQHFPSIETVHIKLRKPDILPNCTVGLSDSWQKNDLG
jgi:dihydroneopterin aldolase